MMGELTQIRVTDHYIGESGKGKSQLDGHFGVKGSSLRRLVAAALHDIITPDTLFQGVKKTLGRNEAAQLFQPDRSKGSTLDTASIKQLSAMSHREYEYASDGSFVALVLRQQARLGDGLSVEAAKLRKPGASAFAFAEPRLLASAGATSGPSFDASGARAPDMSAAAAAAAAREHPRAAAADGPATVPAAAAALPIARNQAGREYAAGLRAQRGASREEKRVQREAAARAADVKRCQQSEGYWCKLDPDGCPTCNKWFPRESDLRRHLASGRHMEGGIRPYVSGVAAGRGSAHDRDVRMVSTRSTPS